MTPESDRDWVLWGSELSPFALKVEALLRFRRIPYHWLPAAGDFGESLRFDRRRRQLIARRLPLTWPRMTELDEFPLVPFLFGPAGENLYDSSAIGAWLDQQNIGDAAIGSLLPADAAMRFVVRLADEAFDEIGLYLVHHNRWVVSARDNDAGKRLAHEMRPLLGPLARIVGYAFPARQVRRLPYLFSVAPAQDASSATPPAGNPSAAGSASFADLPRRLQPPARRGFPPTQRLLEQACRELLAAVEPILAQRPFLFGTRFTLADASLYGQLGMNRKDPSARAMIARAAPATQAWIERLAQGDFAGHQSDGALTLDGAAALLNWICRFFVPLMQQNHQAWLRHRAAGQNTFNEAAFNRGAALYDGMLIDQPFRSVVKTFQVKVWQELRSDWNALSPSERQRLEQHLPMTF